jgi:GT2 family glycosyltransferase
VLASTGDRLILLNDDVEARSQGWVEELLAPLEEESVGLTGAMLYYSSDTIQHAGVAASNSVYMHPFKMLPRGAPGPFGVLRVNREVYGVTGACVGVRRETFLEVGGLTEEMPENFNDVDFSCKIWAAGLRVLMLPRCELFHFETQTRTTTVQQWEFEAMRQRWGTPTRDLYTPDYWNLPQSPRERREQRARAQKRQQRVG